MSKPIIKIENLSKQYRLGIVGTGTIKNDLKRWWYRTRGKEDPFLKIGDTNQRNIKGESDYVWALKNINLEIMPGEILGIIGKNGAGKSTLLKILSKVTGPTTGSISFNGRIGSLLEVGTGFHPELTGRENIFLNGAILGMTKTEIRSKLAEIIDFSGVERYIDTPVKRYSSGMMVRLGFAVAAHLEPEILVVDEVLAVGDAEFQKKAIGKMQDVSKNEGRTVLFVSHNMASIQQLCKTGLLLKNGEIEFADSIDKVINYYQHDSSLTQLVNVEKRSDRRGKGNLKVIECVLKNEKEEQISKVVTGSKFILDVKLRRLHKNYSPKNLNITANITDTIGKRLFHLSTSYLSKIININEEYTSVRFFVDKFPLSTGTYSIGFYIADELETQDWIDFVKEFSVESGDFFNTGRITNAGVFYVDHAVEKLD